MAHKLDRFQTLRTLGIVAQSLKPVKLMSQQFPIATFFLFRDRRSVAQQCWIRWHNIVGATHAYYTWSLKSSRLYPFHDPLREPTLLGVVTSVCIPLLAQQCWELLCPFSRSSRIEGTSRTTDRAPTDCACSRSLVDINTVFQCTVGAVRSI